MRVVVVLALANENKKNQIEEILDKVFTVIKFIKTVITDS